MAPCGAWPGCKARKLLPDCIPQAWDVVEAIGAALGGTNVSAMLPDGAACGPKVELGALPSCRGDGEQVGGCCWDVENTLQHNGCSVCLQESIAHGLGLANGAIGKADRDVAVCCPDVAEQVLVACDVVGCS